MKCTACGNESTPAPVSITPNHHENVCRECKAEWENWARRMGCPKQPALALMYFRQWQHGARRAA